MEIFFKAYFMSLIFHFVQVQFPWEFLSGNFNGPVKLLISNQPLISNTQQANIKLNKKKINKELFLDKFKKVHFLTFQNNNSFL